MSLQVFLGFCLMVSSVAHANVADEADRVAYEVRRGLPTLNTRQTSQISQQLQNIMGVLRGSTPGQPTNSYVCVSRDNDGANPFVIGIRNLATVTRIPNTTFATKVDCENGLQTARPIRGLGLALCVSRDNDGGNPWRIGLLDNSIARVEHSDARTLVACQAAVRDMRVLRDGILFCGSRDNDGFSPFVQIGIPMDGSRATIGNENYTSYEACRQAL